MQSYLVDRKDKDALALVEQAYWDLFDMSLLCAPGFTGPSIGEVKSGRFQAILCKEDNKVIGVMCVKTKTNGVYYPAMKGSEDRQRDILTSMCALAQETFSSLNAQTTNEYIHKLAQEGGLPFEYDENHVIQWRKK